MENNPSNNNPGDEYFAAKSPDQLASILLGKSRSFFNLLESNAYLEKLNNMWRAYHGDYGSQGDYGHKINFTGEQGEYVTLVVNHFRNIAEHMLNIITANRPIMEARAINTDYKSESQTYLANGILDYYMREKGLENCLKNAAEMAIVIGSGFIKLAWNATAGETFDADPDTGEIAYEGEIEFSNLSPFDVVVDGTKESWNNEWIMTRSWENRFNLIAKYPELASKIKGIPSKSTSQVYRLGLWSNDDTDDVPVYEFFHKRTEAMPDGRYVLFLDSDVILLDTKMPYRVLPVFRIAPSNIMGTPYGYSPMFDILPLQEGLNALYSTIMTNNNAFGVQNLWVPPGSDISVTTLAGAMNVIESQVKPESLQLTASAPETYKFVDELVKAAETLSGISSVTRGNPEASLKSGTALALVQSMSLQFMSGLQQSYIKMIEDIGTALINILKDFAKTPKIVALVGKNNRTFLKQFTGDDISAISRVVIDVGNPLSRTIAGRVQMAEQLLQMKAIDNPNQYFQVLNTGRLDSMYEGEMTQLLLIKAENERLMEGRQVKSVATDNHKEHILEHRTVLSDPDLRENLDLVKNVQDHIQGHLDFLRNTDPGLLQITNQQPLPPVQGPGQGQGAPQPNAPGGPGGPPPPPQGQPHQGALKRSPNPNVMAPNAGLAQPGEAVQGPGQQASNLPNIAKPAKPFQNNPVLATQLSPPKR